MDANSPKGVLYQYTHPMITTAPSEKMAKSIVGDWERQMTTATRSSMMSVDGAILRKVRFQVTTGRYHSCGIDIMD